MNPDLRATSAATAFQMKGGLYTLTTLELHTVDTALIRIQLQNMTRKAPNFFDQAPAVIHLGRLPAEQNRVALPALKHLLHEFGMILVAIQGGSERHKAEAWEQGIGWLPESLPRKESRKVVMMKQKGSTDALPPAAPQQVQNSRTRIIDRPVRSGQQIYAPGDLVVIGAVNTGAELLAGGHIHIYGTLRGRALAGINGNLQARIFCRKFEAELISISGQYKLPVYSDQSCWGESVLISLNNQYLCIDTL